MRKAKNRRKSANRPIVQFDMLEPRQLLSTTLGGGDIFQFTDLAGNAVKIGLVGNITAEFYAATDTGAGLAIGDMEGSLTRNGSTAPIDADGNGTIDPVDLFRIDVTSSDQSAGIYVYANGDPYQSTTYSLAGVMGVNGLITNAPVTAMPGSAWLGGRTVAGPNFTPIHTVGALEGGLYTLGGESLGYFFFGGTVTGAVNITGSINEFYAGLILTGRDEGVAGFRNPTTGVINPVAEPGNFYVAGDMNQLIAGSAIGTNPGQSGTAPTYWTGFDLRVLGKLGAIVTSASDPSSVNISEGDIAGNVTVGSNSPVTADRLLYNQTEYEGIVPSSLVPALAFEQFQLTASGARNDNPQETQVLGTDFQTDPTDTNYTNSDDIHVSGTLNHEVDSVTGLPDTVDYYGAGVMAGETISVQLVTKDVVFLIPSGTVEAGDIFRVTIQDALGNAILNFQFTAQTNDMAQVVVQMADQLAAALAGVGSGITVQAVGDVTIAAIGPRIGLPSAIKLVTENLGDRIQVHVATFDAGFVMPDAQMFEVYRERIYAGLFDPDDRLVQTDYSRLEGDTSGTQENNTLLPETTGTDVRGQAFNYTTDRPGLYRFAVGTPFMASTPSPRQPWDKSSDSTGLDQRPFNDVWDFGIQKGMNSYNFEFNYLRIGVGDGTTASYAGNLPLWASASNMIFMAGSLSARDSISPTSPGGSIYAITGDVSSDPSNMSFISYGSNSFTITFSQPVPDGMPIYLVASSAAPTTSQSYELIVKGVGETAIGAIDAAGSMWANVSAQGAAIGYVKAMQTNVAVPGRITAINVTTPGVRQVGTVGTVTTSNGNNSAMWLDPDLYWDSVNSIPRHAAAGTADYYKGSSIYIVSGPGAGQLRLITASTLIGNNIQITVGAPWTTPVGPGSVYLIGPTVTITSGTGAGAAAYAVIDNLDQYSTALQAHNAAPGDLDFEYQGQVTSIVVINPGVNYAPGTTQITLADGQGRNVAAAFGNAGSTKATAAAVVATPTQGGRMDFSVNSGDLKALVAYQGLQANIHVTNGDIGLIRSGGDSAPLGPTHPADWATGWTYPPFWQGSWTSADYIPYDTDMVLTAVVTTGPDGGGSVQQIESGRDLSIDLVTDAAVGVVRVGRDLFGSIYIGHDNVGSDGTLDLLDVGRDMYHPTLSHGLGGNFRYVRVSGNIMDRSNQPEPWVVLPDFQPATITDDSGAVFTITPVSNVVVAGSFNPATTVDPVTGLPKAVAPAHLEYQVYEITDGTTGFGVGSVLTAVRTNGSILVQANTNGSGGTVELTDVIVLSDNDPKGRVPKDDPITGQPILPLQTPDPADLAKGWDRVTGVYLLGTVPVDVMDIIGVQTTSGWRDLTFVQNLTGGETVSVTANSVGQILVSADLGVAHGHTGAAVMPRYFSDEFTSMATGPTQEQEARGFGLDRYPFYQGRNLIIAYAFAEILAGGSIGNVIAEGASPGKIGRLVAGYNHPLNVSDGVFRGIVAPIYAANAMYNINVGEGVAPSGNGEFAQSGLFCAGDIFLVTTGGAGADIRGDIVAVGDIVTLNLNGASLINTNVLAGTDVQMSREYDAVNPSTFLAGGTIGTISTPGRGGILGTVIGGQSIGAINASGFGIVSCYIFVQSGLGQIGAISAGGYGIRNVRIDAGLNEGPLTASGNGKVVSPASFVVPTLLPSSGLDLDAFDNVGVNSLTDLSLALRDGHTGVIESVDAWGKGSLGMVKAFWITDSRFRFANVLQGFSSKSSDASQDLTIVGGGLKSFAFGGDLLSTRVSIAGRIDTLKVNGDLAQDSSIQSIGQNGYIGTITILGDLGGTIASSSSAKKIVVRGNYTGTLRVEQGQGVATALGTLQVGGNLTLTNFDTSTPWQAGGFGDVGTIQVGGNLLGDPSVPFDIGSLNQLTVGGTMTNLDLNVHGDLNSASLKGAVNNVSIDVDGNVGSLTFSTATDLELDAASVASLTAAQLVDADIDVDHKLANLKINGIMDGDVTAESIDKMAVTGGNVSGSVTTTGGALKSFALKNGNLDADITSAGTIDSLSLVGHAMLGRTIQADKGFGKVTIQGTVDADIFSGRSIGSLTVTGGDVTGDVMSQTGMGTVKIGGRLLSNTLRTGGAIGSLTVGGLMNATVSTRDDITKMVVTGNADGAQILAGLDVGDDRTLGTADDELHAGSIGSLAIAGLLKDSVVSAGVDRGADNDFATTGDNNSAAGASAIKSATVGSATGANVVLADAYIDGRLSGAVLAGGGTVQAYAPAAAIVSPYGTDVFGPAVGRGTIPFVFPGDLVLSLSGAGSARYDGAGHLYFEGTNATSVLTLRYTGTTAYFQPISITGADDSVLGKIVVISTITLGNVTVDGYVGSIQAGSVLAGSTWSLMGGAGNVSVANPQNLNVQAGNIGSWAFGTAYNGATFQANNVGTLTVAGASNATLDIRSAAKLMFAGAFSGSVTSWASIGMMQVDAWAGTISVLHGDYNLKVV